MGVVRIDGDCAIKLGRVCHSSKGSLDSHRSFQIGGHRRSRVQDAEPGLRRWIAAEPGLTLQELRERLAKQGIAIKIGALWHQLNKWNLTFKKNAARQRARARGRTGGTPRMD